jgi:hypothetical protein
MTSVPLLIRLLLVPQRDWVSLIVALFVGVLAAALYLFYSRRWRRRLTLARQVAAEHALGEDALTLAAQLRVAMSLHDGLAGAVCGARHRLAGGMEPGQARALLGHLILRARQVVGATPVGSVAELAQRLRTMMAAHQLDGSVDITWPDRATNPDELEDLQAVACEALANAVTPAIRSGPQ